LTAGIKAIEDRNGIGGFATKRSNLLGRIGGTIGTVGGALDTLKIKIGNYDVDLSAVFRGVKASNNAYTNKMLDTVRTEVGELIPKTEMKVVTDADLIGGTTPNETMVITEKNV
jgi:hypothetical protein